MPESEQNKLQTLAIQSPCSENWDAMTGDDKQRFCDICDKHVHNLSAMPKKQAELLLTSRAQQRGDLENEALCVRYDRDSSGNILTLPSRLERINARFKHTARVAVAAIVTLAITPWAMATQKQPCPVQKSKAPNEYKMGKPMTHPRPPVESTKEMGDIASPNPQPPVLGRMPLKQPPPQKQPKPEVVAPPEHQPLMGLMKMPDPPPKKPLKIPKKPRK